MNDPFARSDASASPDEPTPPHDHVPTLPVARKVARDMLERYRWTNVRDPHAVIEAYTALRASLAQLLDALDNEVPR